MAELYQPAGRDDARECGAYAFVLLLAAAATAGLAHVTGRSVVLLLVLPALQGLLIGLAAMTAIRRLRISRPLLLTAIAGAAAIVSIAGHAGADYLAARGDWVDRCARVRDLQRISGVAPERAADSDYAACVAEVDAGSFLANRYGLEDSVRAEPRSGAVVGALELIIAVVIASALAARAAAEPQCPVCGRWRVERTLGAAAIGVSQRIADELCAGNADRAAALLEPPDTREEMGLSLLSCPDGHDGGGGVLRLSERTVDRRRVLVNRKVADLVVGAGELAPIIERLAAQEEPA